jgi:hypothetical protein
MEVRVHLHSEKRAKRSRHPGEQGAATVSSSCSPDFAAGKLHGQIAAVLANHPDLEPICKQANLPFEHLKVEAADVGKHFSWLAKSWRKVNPDLVVLARYMRDPAAESSRVSVENHQHSSVAAAVFSRGCAIQAGIRERRPRARVARPTSSPSSSTRGRSSCRTSSTSTSDRTRWMM